MPFAHFKDGGHSALKLSTHLQTIGPPLMLCAPAALGALEQPGVRAFQDLRPLVLGEQGPFSGGIQVTQGTQCTQNKRVKTLDLKFTKII